MAWGILKVSRLVLSETDILQDVTNANTGERSVRFDARETFPGRPISELNALQEDMGTLIGKVIPVSFQRKTEYDGFYQVNDVNTDFEKWAEGPTQSRWSLSLVLIGPDNSVEMDSRVAYVVRENDFDIDGERWHAPPIGHTDYHVGSAIPSFVNRTSEDGVIRVYRDVPSDVNPRWSCSAEEFLAGAVTIRIAGVLREGAGIKATPANWEISNGLVKVTAGGDTLLVSAYTGGAWQDKDWSIHHTDTELLEGFTSASIIRNDPECGIVRLRKDLAPGSVILDLTLRRGSRFVEGFLQRTVSDDISVFLTTPEAYTDNSLSGFVVASANDAAGNRFILGSARAFLDHADGGATVENSTTMDFFLGVVAGGSAAVAGDTAVDLVEQYVGVTAERTGVHRK